MAHPVDVLFNIVQHDRDRACLFQELLKKGALMLNVITFCVRVCVCAPVQGETAKMHKELYMCHLV